MTDNWHQHVKNKNRDDLAAAGKQLFLEKGFLQANVKDICAMAGISRVTFYKHFDSLDHLIFEIQMELLETMVGYVTSSSATSQPNGREELIAKLLAWVTFAKEHPDVIRFILMFDLHYETYDSAMDLRKKYDEYIQVRKQEHFLLRTLEAGIADGTLKPCLAPLETAHFIFTSMMGLLQTLSIHYAAHKEHETLRIAERFIDMLIEYLGSGE